MHPTDRLYPFPAVLGGDPDAAGGLDDMALALILSVIDPGIGGVLVRGQKGTAKSTLVRALTRILPPIDVIAGVWKLILDLIFVVLITGFRRGLVGGAVALWQRVRPAQ